MNTNKETDSLGSKSLSPREAIEFIEEQGVKFIDLQFTDLPGRLQHMTIPVRQLKEETFVEGVPKLDGSSIKGFVGIHESDLMMKPDPSTLAIMSWSPENVKAARFVCDIYWGLGGGRLDWDPRAIAQKAEAEVKNQGYDFSYW